jgi:hypothetical protein
VTKDFRAVFVSGTIQNNQKRECRLLFLFAPRRDDDDDDHPALTPAPAPTAATVHSMQAQVALLKNKLQGTRDSRRQQFAARAREVAAMDQQRRTLLRDGNPSASQALHGYARRPPHR